jgi:prophage regulatory protein
MSKLDNIHVPSEAQNTIIRLPAVIKKTGLSRSTIYGLLAKNMFPARIQLSPRSMGFLEYEINAWLDERIASRSNAILKPNPALADFQAKRKGG